LGNASRVFLGRNLDCAIEDLVKKNGAAEGLRR